MANNYNVQPIYIDTAMIAGWRSLQTLNTGQWGFRAAKVEWQAPVSAGDTFQIIDPVSSLVLLEGSCGVAGQNIFYDFDGHFPAWRDFEVSTLDSGVLLVWYRA